MIKRYVHTSGGQLVGDNGGLAASPGVLTNIDLLLTLQLQSPVSAETEVVKVDWEEVRNVGHHQLSGPGHYSSYSSHYK